MNKLEIYPALLVSIAAVVVSVEIFNDYNKEQAAKEAEVLTIADEVAKQMETQAELNCLSMNIYHEARNDGIIGQRAIAWATMNRTKHENYPDTICEVVYQAVLNDNGIPLRDQCQFSWYCDGKSDEVTDQAAWNLAQNIAQEVFDKYGKETDPTNGSIMYHAHYVDPYWAEAYEKQVRIDSHVFYN